MNLKINGNQIEVPASVKTVAELLTHLELDNRIVVVERNKRYFTKDDHTDTSVLMETKLRL